ncbi:hypothetical protein D9758_002821 [Tetrapyrgos nigripes]|uniref:Uncharacterized protein n=1 Tax=Tetrapyrgos nigripes TaxID=182062 RepID=A0A8H5GR14_9AGAR|nr:hypothetical protein D9758_002821 [Tetrapyrgos nigripes]
MYAVRELVKATRELEEASATATQAQQDQLHRLRLALISSISALPIPLLNEVLEEMKRVVVGLNGTLALAWTKGKGDGRRVKVKRNGGKGKQKERENIADVDEANVKELEKQRDEIVKALYREILERVGDREKEVVVRWWYENLEVLGGAPGAAAAETETGAEKDEKENQAVSGWGEWIRARL